MSVKIKKGDTVEAISGKGKGKRGKVIKVLSSNGKVNAGEAKVLVENLNMIKKHVKPSQKNKEGGILEMEGPIHISNVIIVCPKCNNKTRTGIKYNEDNKTRYCKKCKEVID